jgi:hypothetical protein
MKAGVNESAMAHGGSGIKASAGGVSCEMNERRNERLAEMMKKTRISLWLAESQSSGHEIKKMAKSEKREKLTGEMAAASGGGNRRRSWREENRE